MKRFSRFITEKKMTHVIDRNTGKSVYGPTDVADAKRYLKTQIQPNKFMIRDIKESVELEDGKQVTVKQFVSDEAAQSAIEDAEGLLDSTEVMSGVFAMVFDSKVSKDNFVATHKDSLKEEVQLDEATQHTVHVNVSRTGFRKLEAMIASLDGYRESDYSDGKARFYFDAKKHDSAERKKVAEFIKKTRGAEFIRAVKEDVQLDEDSPCWDDYVQRGMKKKGGRLVPNCVPKNEDVQLEEGSEIVFSFDNPMKAGAFASRIMRDKLASEVDRYVSGRKEMVQIIMHPNDYERNDIEKLAKQYKGQLREDLQLDEAPNPEFLKVYNSLKKGDRVEVEFDSGIRKGNKITLVVTSGNRIVGKARVGRIIMKSPDNMRGVSYTLYNRNGSVSLALGDMATVMKSIKKK